MKDDIKLSFWQILFSPFISLKNMVTSKSDVDGDVELNPNSNDKQEAMLAKSYEKVNDEVQNYGSASRAKRNEILEKTKVTKDQLSKTPTEQKAKPRENNMEIGEK